MYSKLLIKQLVPGDTIITTGSNFFTKTQMRPMRVVVATEKLSAHQSRITWFVLNEPRRAELVVELLEHNINIGYSWTLISAKSR